MTYKRKLFLYFLIAFMGYLFIDIAIQLNREKRYKTENLVSDLKVYSEVVQNYLLTSKDTTSVIKLLPENVRLSIINNQGVLQYDNIFNIRKSDNHFNRPEILGAQLNGNGYSIRESNSTGKDYLYFAEKTPEGNYIRTALPYSLTFNDFFHKDSLFLYSIMLLFIITLFILLYFSDKFGKVMTSLKKFVTSVEAGKIDYDAIEFPDTDSGEIGAKIISIYKQLEESKREIDIEKDRNRQIKQEMTNNIAHELKTPVSSIRGYLEILLGDKPITPEKKRYFLERSYSQTLRLSDLINDVAFLTKMEEAASIFEKEKINVREVAEEAIEELSFRLNPTQFFIENKLSSHIEIVGNKTLVYSIFRNLIENAINYAGENILISIQCCEEDDEYYHFLFYDTGCGVKPEFLERIFDRFLRTDEGRSRRNGGSGLGLAIVKHAVLFHHGEIVAKNRKTGGLEFYFSLKKRK